MEEPEPDHDEKPIVETDGKPSAADDAAAAPEKVDFEGNSHGCTLNER